jgi:hypothetical protein
LLVGHGAQEGIKLFGHGGHDGQAGGGWGGGGRHVGSLK